VGDFGLSRLVARGAPAAACALALTLALPPVAIAVSGTSPGGTSFDPGTQRETHLISQTYDGSWPDGPSQDPAFSQDRQYASVAAFDSDADNLVPGDTNGTTDVFAVYREQPYSLAGEPWRIHSTELISRGMFGAPADGPSSRPDVDGDQLHTPRCIAFISAADNLVPGDTNGVPDAFVYDLYTHQIQRVSVASDGSQADGPTTEVKVDGGCTRVAFVSTASNLALTSSLDPAAAKLVTSAPPAGTKQVYVHVLGDRGNNAGLQGLTFLASATSHGVAGNGDSAELAFARSPVGCGGLKTCVDSGAEALYFTSTAQNLSPNDTDPGADIYKRTFVRDNQLDPVAVRTRLITLGANGPSHHPATNDTGRYVAFTTAADNLFPGDTNASLDVVRVDTATTPFHVDPVSQSAAVGDPGNDNSDGASIARPGSPVFFASDASNLQPTRPARPGIYSDEKPGPRRVLLEQLPQGVAGRARLQEPHRQPAQPLRQPGGAAPGAAGHRRAIGSPGRLLLRQLRPLRVDLPAHGPRHRGPGASRRRPEARRRGGAQPYRPDLPPGLPALHRAALARHRLDRRPGQRARPVRQYGELRRRAEGHLAHPDRRVVARGGPELGEKRVVVEPTRLAQPGGPPRPRGLARAQRVDAGDPIGSERGRPAVRPGAGTADRRVVQLAQRRPVLDQVPVLVPAGLVGSRRAGERGPPRWDADDVVERAERGFVAIGLDASARAVPEDVGQHGATPR
jgi:hypothetical protein